MSLTTEMAARMERNTWALPTTRDPQIVSSSASIPSAMTTKITGMIGTGNMETPRVCPPPRGFFTSSTAAQSTPQPGLCTTSG